MGVVVSAISTGLVQNVQKDFVKCQEAEDEDDEEEKRKKKAVKWREEELVKKKEKELVEKEKEEGRRVEIPGFPPVKLDIQPLHTDGGKQGRLSRNSQYSQTESRTETETGNLEDKDGGEVLEDTAEEGQEDKTEVHSNAAAAVFRDFLTSIGMSSRKELKETKSPEDRDSKDGLWTVIEETITLQKRRILEPDVRDADTDDTAARNGMVTHPEDDQTRTADTTMSPSRRRRMIQFLKTPGSSPPPGPDDGGQSAMPIVNLLPQYESLCDDKLTLSLPRLTEEMTQEQRRPTSAWFRKSFTNLSTVQRIYLTHPKYTASRR